MATRTKTVPQRAQSIVSLPLVLGALIWLGFNLRSVLLEVPPVLPLIQRDLHLSYTAVGFLNALPALIMGAGAFPAVLVIRRLGSRTTVGLGLGVLVAGALLRALAANTAILLLLTGMLSVGIALSQTTVPVVIREWFPRHAGQATAAYSTGLMVGEVLSAIFTAPLLLSWLGAGNWRGTFVAWGVPVLTALILWLVAVPKQGASTRAENARLDAADEHSAAAPTLRTWRGWQVSLLLGCGSMIFFGMETWIPVYYHHLGRTDTTLALAALTIAQLPATLALTIFGQYLAGRPIGFIIAGTTGTAAMLAWFFAPPSWYLALAAVLGASSAANFVLGMSLPPLLGRGHAVAQLSGMMLTISYTASFIGPFLGGVLWDVTGMPILTFAPILLGTSAVVVLGAFMPTVGREYK